MLFTAPFRIGEPRISPRGDQVAFTLHDSPSAVELHAAWNRTGTVEVVGKDGKRRTLGAPWRYVVNPVWSADGREVLVSGRREGSAGIHALGLDGHERTVLELSDGVDRRGAAEPQPLLLRLGTASCAKNSGAEQRQGSPVVAQRRKLRPL